jgi:hypothetical protein
MNCAPAQLLLASQQKLDRQLQAQRLPRGLGSLSAVVTQKTSTAGTGSQKQSLLSLRENLVHREQQQALQGQRQRQVPQVRQAPQQRHND